MNKLILLGLIFQIMGQNLDSPKNKIILGPMPTLTSPTLQQQLSTSAQGDKYWSTELTKDQLPTNVQEYGYGYWVRFLTTYPIRLWQGKSVEYYFLARLTNNKNSGDIAFGDRLLAIFLGGGGYSFITCNTVDYNPNAYKLLVHPQDIEGLWTYMYYSYNKEAKSAVGFVLYGNQQPPLKVQFATTHPDIKYLQLMIGGAQYGMPGFNGQVYNIKLFVGKGYIADEAQFLSITGSIPDLDLKSLIQFNQVNQSQAIGVGQGSESYTQVGGGQDAFPKEYSVSGWFKWTGPYTAEQHLVFRLSINDQNYNQDNVVLGDRTLAVFARKDQSFRCSTYAYQNMKAEGISDYYQDVQHHGKIEEWHFLYFGYSKNQTRAFFMYQTKDSQDSQDFIRINHYLVDHFYFSLIDSRYPNYNGQEALININLGPGAFSQGISNYKTIDDVFQYTLGLNTFLKSVIANQTNSSQSIGVA